MTTVHPFSPGPIVRPMVACRRTHPEPPKRRRLKAIQAYNAPSAAAGTVVPAALAALAAPGVQVNAAALFPHVQALLAGPFGPLAVALGCGVSAGVATSMRMPAAEPRKQMMQCLGAAGQAGLGAPLMFGALRLALGPATAATLLARGVVLGVATLLGAVAGRQAGHIAGNRMPAAGPPKGQVFSESDQRRHRRAHAKAARQGSHLGGLAAGAIVGIAALRAL